MHYTRLPNTTVSYYHELKYIVMVVTGVFIRKRIHYN